jgi:hypothetical protein
MKGRSPILSLGILEQLIGDLLPADVFAVSLGRDALLKPKQVTQGSA